MNHPADCLGSLRPTMRQPHTMWWPRNLAMRWPQYGAKGCRAVRTLDLTPHFSRKSFGLLPPVTRIRNSILFGASNLDSRVLVYGRIAQQKFQPIIKCASLHSNLTDSKDDPLTWTAGKHCLQYHFSTPAIDQSKALKSMRKIPRLHILKKRFLPDAIPIFRNNSSFVGPVLMPPPWPNMPAACRRA